jgi:HEAT repeat protein
MGSPDRNHIQSILFNYLGKDTAEKTIVSAIELLGCVPDEEVALRLLMLMDDHNLQQKALDALIEIGQKSPQTLLQLWNRLNTAQRCWVSFVFGENKTVEATDLLTSALSESVPQFTSMALFALGRIGALTTMPDILNCLACSDMDVQVAACRALIDLGRLRPDQVLLNIKPLSSHPDPFVRQLIVSIWGELKSADALDPLVLASKDSDPRVRTEAVKGLSKLHFGEKVNVLQLCLTDENVEVRRAAIEGLASSDSAETFYGLCLAIEDDDMWVRAAAVRGLGRFDRSSSIDLIINAIDDSVGFVSIAALETLSKFHPDSALPKLLHALNHADEEVVRSSLGFLDRYWDCDWIHKQAAALIDHDLALVRSHIARRLVECQDQRAQSLLEGRLKSEINDVLQQELRHLLSRLSIK